MNANQRHLLLILDGWGLAEDPSASAIDAAEHPFIDSLFEQYPHARLDASGEAVGLPEGQMGNSEVGHMNLGAGRVVYQEITRINRAIRDGSFFENEALAGAARHAKRSGGRLHLMGLVSDGGVHSSLEHLFALMELAQREGLDGGQVCIHAFADGRDTDPHAGAGHVRQVQEKAKEIGAGRVVSLVGRYFAMDRDERWDRTEKAYRLLTEGKGETFDDPAEALEQSYEEDITDEFVEPRAVRYDDLSVEASRVKSGDAAVFFNFRADRARQLTRAFTETGFDPRGGKGFDRGERLSDFYFATMSPYEKDFDLPVAFDKVDLAETIGEVIAARGGTQLRVAETEKYAHVTYFFSGGREAPFEGEERILVPSPKVATYDEKPEMSAAEVAEKAARFIRENGPNFVCLNFANPDMVGHTGDFGAAVKAVEAVDRAAKVVVEAALEEGYGVTVIADHGNADKLKNEDGSPNTAHTTALVPHLIAKKGFGGPIRDGKLGDIAPTILRLMGEEIPKAMDGDVLVDVQAAAGRV